MTPTVLDTLCSWQGKSAFFEPLHGNNGDHLIELGALHAIQKAGLVLTASPHDAEVIIVNGGAGLTDVWIHAFDTLKKLLKAHPHTPLVVLPSTINFSDPTILMEPFARRQAPTHIYCRERNSLERLEGIDFPDSVTLGLDHDMAFHLDDSDLLKNLRKISSNKHILVVERADREGITGAQEKAIGKSRLKRFIPPSAKRGLKRTLLGRRACRSLFSKSVQSFLQREEPDIQDLPTIYCDVSRPDLATFHQFCRFVSQSACVVTTRLHVGILAAMLQKRTYVVAGLAKLGKISGIHTFSMQEMKHVKLIQYDNNDIVYCNLDRSTPHESE